MFKRDIFLTLFLLIAVPILPLFNNTNVIAYAQTPITPTLYCVGGNGQPPCAPFGSPTGTAPSAGVSTTPGTGSTTPSGGANPSTNPTPTIDPCSTQSSVQTNNKSKKKYQQGRGGFLELFFRFIFWLIQLILGGGNIPLPNPNGPTVTPTVSTTPGPSGTSPTPCPDPSGVTPSTTVPSISQPQASPSGGTQPSPVSTGPSLYVSTTGNDSNPGTQAAPFKTIKKASTVATPGTTVHVAAGTYNGSFTTDTNGNASARITYVSDVKWGAKVIGGSGEASWRNNGDYVNIQGFEITGSTVTGLQESGSFVSIINNHIYGFTGDCTNSYPYSIHDVDFIGNVVHGCGSTSLHHGIYIGYPTGKILNNIAYDNSGYGIHCWHNCNNQTIANNVVFNNRAGGMVIGQGDGPNNGSVKADNFIVSNNIAYNNSGAGIEEHGATGSNNKFMNNIVFGNTGKGLFVQTGTQTNTITIDPQFVNYKADGSGDYHLKAGSPGIDKGTTTGAPTTDIDGKARPQGAGIDIGVYEQ